MTAWAIKTELEVNPDTDQFVDGLEVLLACHIQQFSHVNPDAANSPMEWAVAMLEGVTFVQNVLLNNPDPRMIAEATLNIANIALTFNRRVNDGITAEYGVRQVIPTDAQPISDNVGEASKVQGSGEELP